GGWGGAAGGEAPDGAGLGEVEPSRQLADDHEVGPLDDLALERRGVDQHRETLGRPEVRVEVEFLANGQKASLRTLLVRHVVPFGPADRTEEDRVRPAAQLERPRGQGRAGRIDGRAAHEPTLELEHGAGPFADG